MPFILSPKTRDPRTVRKRKQRNHSQGDINVGGVKRTEGGKGEKEEKGCTGKRQMIRRVEIPHTKKKGNRNINKTMVTRMEPKGLDISSSVKKLIANRGGHRGQGNCEQETAVTKTCCARNRRTWEERKEGEGEKKEMNYQ